MKKHWLIMLILIFTGTGFSFGYVSSLSNMFGSYPSFEGKTMRPRKPYGRDEYSLSKYRKEVKDYIQDSEDYINASKNDIALITHQSQLAVESANEVIDEYNRFVRSSY